MPFFDNAGGYDENSFWYLLRDPALRAQDQAIKARREIAELAARQEHAANHPGADRLRMLESQVVALESRLMSLGLYTRTILQVLQDKGVLTADEFAAQLKKLDLEDGKLDGR